MQCHNGSVDIFLKYQITLHSNWFENNMWFVNQLVKQGSYIHVMSFPFIAWAEMFKRQKVTSVSSVSRGLQLTFIV